ncbi:MAG: hypothetical protein JSW52_06565 [Candidatus Coatesbacteria bacterium]|nr:MAG: hypothetical protein JSW52_06565 [Candidatus Coatesbacteria bacterium]
MDFRGSQSSHFEEFELPDERRDELVEKIARAVVDRNLAAPAIFFLETMKPLSFVGSQVMVFFDPIVRSIFDFGQYNEVRLALEHRENVELLLRKIEAYDADFRRGLKEKKQERRERKRARRGK